MIKKSTGILLSGAVFGGTLGSVLRRMLYSRALDEKGLLIRGHFLGWALGAVAVITAMALILHILREPEEPAYCPKGICAAFGAGALGVGILLELIRGQQPQMLGPVWKILGILAAAGLGMEAFSRLRWKAPSFLGTLPGSLFLLVHLVANYRTWSAQPQVQNYLFDLLTTVGLMFFAYYTAAIPLGKGNRRLWRLFGLLTVEMGIIALSRSGSCLLWWGGILFAAGSLLGAGEVEA